MQKLFLTNLLLLAIALISIICSISFGSVSIGLPQIIHTLLHPTANLTSNILFKLRLPRTLNAFITGGSLALAGSYLQILLCNPLADPYILGVSGGAAVASLTAFLIGIGSQYLPGCAFLGGLLSMGLLIYIAQQNRQLSINRLLLSGVMLASGWGAIISLLLTLSSAQDLHTLLFWLMGDINYQPLSKWSVLVLAVALIISLRCGKALNMLAYGELTAKSAGTHTTPLQFLLYGLSGLLTASAVSQSGCIGFVGLVVPHLLRLMGIRDQRFMSVGCILLGGSLLTFADCLARTMAAPVQLPVGILTVALGVPFFLGLLR